MEAASGRFAILDADGCRVGLDALGHSKELIETVFAMQLERAVVRYSGHVQGVGFRFTCRRAATGFSVTGYVRNLADGQVELAAEGERAEVEAFLQDIETVQLKPYIRNRTIDWQPATGEWRDFRIEH